jgi:ribonuclease-3
VLVDTRGEEHDKVFDVLCRLASPAIEAVADGSSRRQAEQRAASRVLEQLVA